MDPKRFIEWALMASLSGTGAFIASYVKNMADSVETISKSVKDLNSKIEVMSADVGHSNEEIHDHETRLRAIERRQYR